MEKTIIVDGKKLRLRATAAVPRLYRMKFGRDIMKDMAALEKSYAKAVTQEEQFAATDLELFENCAYIMARHADPENVPESIEGWLDEFDTFSIYLVLPEIMELWNINQFSQVESKKKLGQVAGK